MVRRLAGACAAGLFLLAAPLSHAQTDTDRFELWNGCGTVRLAVRNLSDDAGEIGLTRDAVTTAARSRLRGARIYDGEADPYLSVSVHVAGSAFSMDIRFNKPVTDDSGRRGFAATWSIESTGTHGVGGADRILSWIAQDTDRFIDEYLRVNADAC